MKNSNELYIDPRQIGDLAKFVNSGGLESAGIIGVHFNGVDFSGADLSYQDLTEIEFSGAKLFGCDLRYANLQNAYLVEADLREAELHGADLTGAQLSGACLQGAVYDRFTKWPVGFRPRQFGAIPKWLYQLRTRWNTFLVMSYIIDVYEFFCNLRRRRRI